MTTIADPGASIASVFTRSPDVRDRHTNPWSVFPPASTDNRAGKAVLGGRHWPNRTRLSPSLG